MENDIHKKKPKPSVIHLSLVIGGARSTLQAVTLMKSLFYHHSSPQLDIKNNTHLEVPSNGVISQHYQHLHLHLIVERMAYQSLSTLLDSWNLPGLCFSFYQVEKYLEHVVWIPTNHYSGIYGLVKIILTEILPQNLEKVIFLDCDLLMNADISQLWAHFDHFLSKQVIGLAENQSPWYVMGQSNVVWPAIVSGLKLHDRPSYNGVRAYNTGVMLLHLERLRRLPWNHLWRNATIETLKFLPYAPLADQDVINTALKTLGSNSVYKLPCEWNRQLVRNAQPKNCSVSWDPANPDHHTDGTRYLKIAHFNNQRKPDILWPDWFEPINESQNGDYIIDLQLRQTFIERYRYFRDYDGQVLKNKIEEICPKWCWPGEKKRRRRDKLETPNSICARFNGERQIYRRVHPFFFPCEIGSTSRTVHSTITTSAASNLTLVSQLSFDRKPPTQSAPDSMANVKFTVVCIRFSFPVKSVQLRERYIARSHFGCKQPHISQSVKL
ncbi:hypothetical protein AHF37_10193 [Paragonimus kellicotti]|nr:hypothetical protein AHF37_10193 [Paragonimus kellicotti]